MFTRRPNLEKGLAAGAVAGLAGSLAMNAFQLLWNTFVPPQRPRRGSTGGPQEDTTIRAARAVSEGVFDRRLSGKEKAFAGSAVHYTFGGAVGALYGAVAERHPKVTGGGGLPFGVVFWLVADEMAVPALGLSKPASAYPLSVHAYALASHLVFGATAESVRRFLRARI
jgi:putative membrane protein